MRDPYVILGVRPTATAADIKAAYRKRVLRFHPDRAGDDPRAVEKMAALNAAYELLRSAEDPGEMVEAPANPTTYLRLVNENERTRLEKAATATEKRSRRARLVARLTRPLTAPPPAPRPVVLSSIRIEDRDLTLVFDQGSDCDALLLVMPALTAMQDGTVRVDVTRTRCTPARRTGRGAFAPAPDVGPLVAGHDGPVRLQFDS